MKYLNHFNKHLGGGKRANDTVGEGIIYPIQKGNVEIVMLMFFFKLPFWPICCKFWKEKLRLMLLVANSFSRRRVQMQAICQTFCWESWSLQQWANRLCILTHTLTPQAEKFAFSPKVYFALPPFPSSWGPPGTHPLSPNPTGTSQASTWLVWWCAQGEPPREAFSVETEAGTQELLNYLTRQMVHSVRFLT